MRCWLVLSWLSLLSYNGFWKRPVRHTRRHVRAVTRPISRHTTLTRRLQGFTHNFTQLSKPHEKLGGMALSTLVQRRDEKRRNRAAWSPRCRLAGPSSHPLNISSMRLPTSSQRCEMVCPSKRHRSRWLLWREFQWAAIAFEATYCQLPYPTCSKGQLSETQNIRR